MFSQHPDIAKRWAKKYGVPKNLPQHKNAQIKQAAIDQSRRK